MKRYEKREVFDSGKNRNGIRNEETLGERNG
jgi:hypothetical protein